jgi:Flp pilus assembly protein TadD
MNSSAHCELGLLLVVEPRRNIDGAEAAFRAAIAADASNGRALLGLGTLLIKERRDVDGAEAAFRAALCADPADEGAVRSLVGLLAKERNDMQGALDVMKAAQAEGLEECAMQ